MQLTENNQWKAAETLDFLNKIGITIYIKTFDVSATS